MKKSSGTHSGSVVDVTGRRVAAGSASAGDFTYSIVEIEVAVPQTGEAQRDRRADARQRTRLRDGILLERRHRVLAECRISDRSRSGARLHLDQGQALPQSFLLSDPASGKSYRASLVWRRGRDAGVRLVPLDTGSDIVR